MPQQQINIPLPSPGFGGLNTEDSPLTSDPSFCSVANNCTIDKLGRLSSRRGFKYLTANPNILQDVAGVAQPIAVMGEFIKEDTGVSTLFACGNNKIFIQQTVTPFELIEQTLPAGYTIGSPTVQRNNWQMAQLNDKMYFVQAGQAPLVYSGTLAEVDMTGIAVAYFNFLV